MKRALVIAFLASLGCAGRTTLRPLDGHVDDDPWLRTDAAVDTAPDARDGGEAGVRDAGRFGANAPGYGVTPRVQRPATQRRLLVQTLPHPPQFAASVCVFTQRPLQLVSLDGQRMSVH
jgi:hypothetical protein